MSDEEKKTTSTGERPGIHGWLLVWTINLVLLFFIDIYMFWIVPIRAVREQPSELTIAAVLYGILFYIFTLYAAIKFFQLHNSARYLMIVVLIANVGFWVITGMLWDNLVSKLPDSGGLEVFESLVRQFVGSIAACLIWVPYFLISKRVKHTFVP